MAFGFVVYDLGLRCNMWVGFDFASVLCCNAV